MATDYTVIQPVRQRFGDNVSGFLSDPHRDWGEYPIEHEAPFVGLSKDFPFRCPSIDRSEWGVLQFNSLGVSDWNNIIQVNGVDVPGGISVGPVWIYINPNPPLWNTHSLLVEGSVLAEDNVLHIGSKTEPGSSGPGGNVDDFIIDNIVIWFKTHARRSTGVAGAESAS
jgi:hypothetical protein